MSSGAPPIGRALIAFILPFSVAAAAALALTPIVRAIARRLGGVAHPRNDRWHAQPVALFGGVVLWCAVALAVFSFRARGAAVPQSVIVGATSMFLLGLIDDLWRLKPSTKLAAQISLGCLVVLIGPVPDWFSQPGPDAFVTILWFVGIANAFNLLDNMDGLCAGVAAIAAVAFCTIVGPDAQPAFGYAAALAGAATAFLVFNFKPASIFMGDSGSLFLGSSLAVLALQGERHTATGLLSSMAVPALIMLMPIFDTVFVTVSRKLSARRASTGGRDHTSHRLVAMGFSERQAVVICYALAAAGGASAVALGYSDLREARAATGVVLIALVLLGVQLARVKVYGGDDFKVLRDRRFTPLLLRVTYKRRIFEVLLDSCLIAVAYYLSYVIRFDRDFPGHEALLVRSFPIVLACQLLSFFFAGMYRGVWRYFSVSDVTTYLRGLLLGTLTSVMTLVYVYRFEGYSRGVFLINLMALALLVVGSRVSFRLAADFVNRKSPTGRPVLVYGAGDGGTFVIRQLQNKPNFSYYPVGIVDDDPARQRCRILGVPVLGGLPDLPAILVNLRPEGIIVSTAKITAQRLDELERLCHESGTKLLRFHFEIEQVSPRGPGPLPELGTPAVDVTSRPRRG